MKSAKDPRICANRPGAWSDWLEPNMSDRTCTFPGCERRYRCSGYCSIHYGRYRNGRPLEDPPAPANQSLCTIDGCERNQVAHGWCKMHFYRDRNQGSVHWTPSVRTDITYTAAHLRVIVARGSAKDRQCIDCGQQADEWSYNHADPAEMHCPIGRPYSLDITNYDPRCRNCHRQLDGGRDNRCDVDGCERKMKAKGLCSMHYQRPSVRLELSQGKGA